MKVHSNEIAEADELQLRLYKFELDADHFSELERTAIRKARMSLIRFVDQRKPGYVDTDLESP